MRLSCAEKDRWVEKSNKAIQGCTFSIQNVRSIVQLYDCFSRSFLLSFTSGHIWSLLTCGMSASVYGIVACGGTDKNRNTLIFQPGGLPRWN